MKKLRSMVKHPDKLLLLIIITVAIGSGFMFRRRTPPPAPIKAITEPSPSPGQSLSAISSDGKINLEMKQKKEANTITWTLTAKQANEASKTIWWQTFPADTTISFPFNTVSPDNKYLFLKQTGPDKTRYLVLTVSGKPLAPESQALEFAESFESKYPDYKITEVTGWGGINLIVFNTDKIAGGKGPSFWFDLSGKSFIQLSNRFD